MTSDGGALDALLETEQRVEQEIAAARAEAEGRVEAAREVARRLGSEAGGALDEALATLRASIDAGAAAAIERLERDARNEAGKYRRVDEETLRRLARRVVALVTDLEPGT